MRSNPRPEWRRYWRLIGLMAVLAGIGIAAGLWYLRAAGVPLRFHAVLAMGLGIGLSLILAGALMGLVFLSARSGHDETVHYDEDHADSDEGQP